MGLAKYRRKPPQFECIQYSKESAEEIVNILFERFKYEFIPINPKHREDGIKYAGRRGMYYDADNGYALTLRDEGQDVPFEDGDWLVLEFEGEGLAIIDNDQFQKNMEVSV